MNHWNSLTKTTDSGFIQNQKKIICCVGSIVSSSILWFVEIEWTQNQWLETMCRKIVFEMLFYIYTLKVDNIFIINKVSCSCFPERIHKWFYWKHYRRDRVWTWDTVSNQYKKEYLFECVKLSSCLLCHWPIKWRVYIHVVPSSHTIIHCQIHVHVLWHFIIFLLPIFFKFYYHWFGQEIAHCSYM